jgi:RNA polymerase sigma-70 factor (ECF subfamily)
VAWWAGNGCGAAIEQLVGRYESRVFRLARNITGNHEDAEEVAQNAFFKAFLNFAAFRGDSRFYTWLVRIAVNEAWMKIRSRRFREVSIGQKGLVSGEPSLLPWASPNRSRICLGVHHRTIRAIASPLSPQQSFPDGWC